MKKNLPNKWTKKAIYDAVNGIVVSGKTINAYDTNVTGSVIPNQYIILSTQSNTVDKANKCEYFWDSDILIDIVTIYPSTSNPGTTSLCDDITDKVRELTDNLTLSPSSNLSIISQTQTFPNNLSLHTDNENIFRNFVRITFQIK